MFNGIKIDKKDSNSQMQHSKNIGKLNKEIYSVYSKINSQYLFDNIYIDQSQIIPGNI